MHNTPERNTQSIDRRYKERIKQHRGSAGQMSTYPSMNYSENVIQDTHNLSSYLSTMIFSVDIAEAGVQLHVERMWFLPPGGATVQAFCFNLKQIWGEYNRKQVRENWNLIKWHSINSSWTSKTIKTCRVTSQKQTLWLWLCVYYSIFLFSEANKATVQLMNQKINPESKSVDAGQVQIVKISSPSTSNSKMLL